MRQWAATAHTARPEQDEQLEGLLGEPHPRVGLDREPVHSRLQGQLPLPGCWCPPKVSGAWKAVEVDGGEVAGRWPMVAFAS